MSKYVVETFYTCSFKIVHKLDELNEKKLSELENRQDGDVKILDVKLNNRKTKIAGEKNNAKDSQITTDKNTHSISSIINKKITDSNDLKITNQSNNQNINVD